MKTIDAKGTPGCTIKIVKKDDNKEIGSAEVVSASGDCKIPLNDEFYKLQDEKEYSLLIYQEDNSSKKQSESFEVKLYIHNTPLTITFKLGDKLLNTNKEISQNALDQLHVIVTNKSGVVLDGKTSYLISDTEITNEEAANREGWKLYKNPKDFGLDKNTSSKTSYIYIFKQ